MNKISMSKVRAYHHGNLRQSLLEAAVELIAESGAAGFTLREVARRAGVSHNAPYRHFRDKDDLLGAVAAQGFEELTLAMTSAAGRHRGSFERLKSSGLAYVEFALRRPQHFAIMFDAALPDTGGAAQTAGGQAFETLLGFIEECQKDARLPPGDPLQLACVAWSLVHGIAKLAIAQHLPVSTEREVIEFTRFALDSTFHGPPD